VFSRWNPIVCRRLSNKNTEAPQVQNLSEDTSSCFGAYQVFFEFGLKEYPMVCLKLSNYKGGKIILASASPRRAELLDLIGLPFERVVSRVDEGDLVEKMCKTSPAALDPSHYVLELSRRKAEEVARRVGSGLVLGVDTVVVLNGQILGKPRDPQEAKEMLSRLSGRTHKVITGLALVESNTGRYISDFVSTAVVMRSLSRDQIEGYVATGEPLDKAGAYAIQGKGALLVERIDGCFYNVVGLPLAKLSEMLEKMGYSGLMGKRWR